MVRCKQTLVLRAAHFQIVHRGAIEAGETVPVAERAAVVALTLNESSILLISDLPFSLFLSINSREQCQLCNPETKEPGLLSFFFLKTVFQICDTSQERRRVNSCISHRFCFTMG